VASEAREIRHLRRVLLTADAGMGAMSASSAVHSGNEGEGTAQDVSIVILTNDRPDLLTACLSSLPSTKARPLELLIVDNGSTKPVRQTALAALVPGYAIQIVKRASPFNFSLFCNEAAALARGRILLFLNDDTVALRPGWLDQLAGWASRHDCGAVGAKLLFPSRRVQHAGLVVGLGGYAGHVEVGQTAEAPGFLGRLQVPHEVSAVTGACLAVEKSKFEAVGGFDANAFPIELGDVDLCLRLASKGWKSVLVPDAVLIHRESATRGRTHSRDSRHLSEQVHFARRWMDRIQDDPYFHPALSLNSQRVRLDG
jgi:GT2 family glycosyltransferase